MKNRNLKVITLFTAIFLLLIFIYMGFNNVYGSMTDWVMQHTVIPDYFRTLFYHTGNIFPNFAMNTGAGENIYYLSYYGLLNPFILLSYNLPFIKMVDYLIAINIIIVIASAFLVYKWLCNNKIDHRIAFISALLFMLINAFFHTHRHIMFVDYLPFLILGLMGIDKYFNHKKSYLYIISVFLMIMTSYYYSVGGLLCLVIYGVYKYITINKKITVKHFFIDGFKFLIPMLIGIIMSLVLLIPTVLAILSSRSQLKNSLDVASILIPDFNFGSLLYSNYSMGFTCIALISLIYLLLHSKGAKLFLSISIVSIISLPIVMYVLNGMLYLRAKVFIPFCPLIALLIAMFLTDLKNRKIKPYQIVSVVLVILGLSLAFKYDNTYFFLDLLLTTIAIIISIIRKDKTIYIVLIVIALCSNIIINKNEVYVSEDTYNDLYSNKVVNLINKVNNKDKTFYRMDNIAGDTSLIVNKVYNANYYQTSIYSSTYNPYYKDFYDNVINNAIPYRNNLLRASTSNIMFETLMGIKYVISSENNVPIGYTRVYGNSNLGIYQNNNVLPLGYSSNFLMSNNDFDKLQYPYRSEALINNIIVGDKTNINYSASIEEANLTYKYNDNLKTKKTTNGYIIDTGKEESVTLNLDQPLNNKILFIEFNINEAPDCKDGDIGITINGIMNKLTCKQWLYFNNNRVFEYAVSSSSSIDKLQIVFSKGYFDISNIKLYTLDYQNVVDSVNKVDKFIIDNSKTKGDIIEGNINVTNDGYFATTIPYDKGFTIYVDNKKTDYEIVNKAFIGFPIFSGDHHIKMIYKAPGYNTGLLGSIIGMFMFIGVIIIENKRTIKN